MTILGIDPGTATTGFGVIKKTKVGDKQSGFEVLDYGIVSTPKTDTEAMRLATIADDLKSLIKKYKPERVGIEKLYFQNNQKTAMEVSQARGVVLLVCQQAGLKIFEFTPLQVKNYICGNGRADKRQIQFMVKKTFGLEQIPKPDDAADALAISLCAALALKNS
jgi:crossover junction endodeoxyribonuclease RuvC